MQAATTINIPSARLNCPVAASAPAASIHGSAGSGKPICSTNTATNKTGAPCLTRNSVVWLIIQTFTRSQPASIDFQTFEHVRMDGRMKRHEYHAVLGLD